ncbi:MAG TPA: hypothetical protein VFB96_26560 [Pirellulaceae bacterium]|nr:hypothetical protein [Pirellulaceae bacterium]
MNPELPLLNQIDVASPCTASWEEMDGDERVRFCSLCRLNVYNLSEMPREEAEDLVRSREGRLCVRFYRRPDGTMLTRDCPVGIRALRQRLVRAVAAIAGLVVAMVSGSLFANMFGRHKPAGYQPPASAFSNWIDPYRNYSAVAGRMVFTVGDVCIPTVTPQPPPPAPANNGSEPAPPAGE